MEYIPNVHEAWEMQRSSLTGFFLYGIESWYNKYAPQPVTTNEIDSIYNLECYIKPDSNVLTVAGSGEQPLFSKLYGAKNITTFDISYNAYVMTTLKIAALQSFSSSEKFSAFIRDTAENAAPYYFLNTPNMPSVMTKLSQLSPIQAKYIIEASMNGASVCINDESCNFYTIPQNKYSELRKTLQKPLPFIWTDIMNLDKKLKDETFDIIWYSNILEFVNPKNQISILENTKKRVNNHGNIFLTLSPCNRLNMISLCMNTFKRPDWNVDVIVKDTHNFTCIVIENTKAR